MASLRSYPSRGQDAGHSDSESNYSKPVAEFKTLYSGISGSHSTRIEQAGIQCGWKPFSMRPPVLVSFILATCTLIGVIEYLAQKSREYGGLSLSAETGGNTLAVTSSQYAPTIIAVLYSLIWTWIDLDIRRIQPWLELSRLDGASAESTLLLDYPFEFLAFIPTKAWKRKHWLVFLSGIIMMLVFWAITPLQSAIFGFQSVIVTHQVSVADIGEFATLDHQLDVLDASVLNDAYAMTWLGRPLPAYTNSDQAFIPFEPVAQGVTDMQPEEMWITTATALSTDLNCWPAIVDNPGNGDAYTFDNGRGCRADLGLMSDTLYNYTHTVLYVGYYNEAHLDWFLENPDCGREASHQFLAICRSEQTHVMTALFCEPSYKKQTVAVAMAAVDIHPLESSITPLDEPEPLDPSEFNATAFEYLLGTGVPPKEFRRDYPRDKIIDQYATTNERNLNWPITNMVGFAVGLMNGSLADLQSATALQAAFTSAHKLIFSAAMPQLVRTLDAPTSLRPGTVQYTLYGIVVSRPISLVIEGILGLVAVFTAVILFLSCRAHSNLCKDPGGIAATLGVFRESGPLLDDFVVKDRYDDKSLQESVQGHRYRLVRPSSSDGQGLRIEGLVEQGHSKTSNTGAIESPRQHKALRPISGALFMIALIAGIAVLAYLKRQEQLLGGLPRPTENFEVLQILENYVPTIFATLVEPFLVLLNRLRCLLQPFHDLRKGNRSGPKAFETPYTTLPPQLAVLRALMSGQILLTSLCVISLLANVLAVALGGLFIEQPVSIIYPVALQQTHIPFLNRSQIAALRVPAQFSDHYYITMANLSASAISLRPWTDKQFAYFPFFAPGDDRDNSSNTYHVQTRGFGIEALCSEIGTSPESLPYVNYTLTSDGYRDRYVILPDGNGSVASCDANIGTFSDSRLNTSLSGYFAQEVATNLRNGSDSTGVPRICERHMFWSWIRADPSNIEGTLKMTNVLCSSVLRTAMFNLTVDAAGFVVSSRRAGAFENLTTITQNETHFLLASGVNIVGRGAMAPVDSTSVSGDANWHNDTLTRDWFNYFLKLMANSTDVVDPNKPLPVASWTVPAVQELYQRLFSTALALNLDGVFKRADVPLQISGTMSITETRILMNTTAFIITIAILGLNIVVVAVLYFQESRPFLPRLPATIGSLLAYVAASRAVREYRESGEGRGSGSGRETKDTTYSFGRFVGVDGKEHVGIEKDPFVDVGYRARNGGPGGLVYRSGRRKDGDSGGP